MIERRLQCSLPIASALLLCSCSGSFDVTPCLLSGQVAFQLGKVPGRFGIGRVTPAPYSVEVRNDALGGPYERRVIWAASLQPGAVAQKRSVIVYGQKLPGFAAQHGPMTLAHNAKYLVGIHAGPDHGFAEFTLDENLPACSGESDL